MKTPQPPWLARQLFDWFCGAAKVEDLRGDLEEWYHHNRVNRSLGYARRKYWQQVFSLLFSYAIRKRKALAASAPYAQSTFSMSMFKNYLKVAARNIYQYRYFSLINAFGLAIGMSISLLLISMYSFISTYDHFHEQIDRIYTVTTQRTEGLEQYETASAPSALAERINREFAGAAQTVRIAKKLNGEVWVEKENIPLQGYFADANFFRVFTFPLLAGNENTALQEPGSMVLTESAAIKIFGSLDVVGKSLEMEGTQSFMITGLMKDHPKNSHLSFEALASYSTLAAPVYNHESRWVDYANEYVYVLLHERAPAADLQQYLAGVQAQEYANATVKVVLQAQPVEGLVTKDLRNGIGPQWEASGFVVFGILALIILLPGIFNYTNMSIARALKRSKEIGLRKTMGGAKGQIFLQFVTETVVITLLSFLGALLIFMVIRVEFQSMLVESSMLDLSLTPRMLGLFLLFALMVGVGAGFFPAMHFAGLNPIQALKGQAPGRVLSASRLRKTLTVVQFSLSFCFIVCVVVFSRQYRSLLTFDFGFNRENIINIDLQGTDGALFKNEFSKLATVQSIALSSGTLGLSSSGNWLHLHNNDSVETRELFVDTDYLGIFNLQLVAGETFPPHPTDTEKYLLVNEAFVAAARLASPAEALGTTVRVDGQELTVIGVVKNFHYGPPNVPIGSFVFRNQAARFTQANLRVDVADAYTTFTQMEKVWKTLSHRHTFKAVFFDDELNEAYISYVTMLKLAGFLGLLAITISILGLLGMVVYTSENRVKEVSVRKVLGASATHLMYLLSRDYVRLILWAVLVGLPVVWFAFEFVFSRIPNYQSILSVWDVLISVTTLLLLGLATISSQTYKAAMANPAETLRAE